MLGFSEISRLFISKYDLYHGIFYIIASIVNIMQSKLHTIQKIIN
jgi:hypothetical protein